MSTGFDAFEITLPKDADPALLAAVETELARTQGVDQVGRSAKRSLDPATLTMWITLAGTALTTAGAAVTVVKQVLELFQRKGIKGAKLVLADGSVLQADEISADDLLKLAQSQHKGGG
jgi:hypothetical protein